jgi:phosphoribulokinase
MVAIGGDSGTGKTTLTRGLADLFGAENILTLCLDDYHTLDREARRRLGITALNPVANNIALMEDHVWALREGRGITKPVYDHTTGTLAAPEAVEPRPLVVVRGLFPLFTERLRAAFDVAVWLDPDEELKYHWKLQRDVAQRGHTVEGVIRQIVERQEDVRRYILPQRAHADMLIRFLPPPGYFPHSGRREAVSLNVQIRQAAHWFPSELRALALDGQGNGAAPSPLRYLCEVWGGRTVGRLDIDGTIDPALAAQIGGRIAASTGLPSARPLGVYVDGGSEVRRSAPLALTQLLVAHRVVAARAAASPGAATGPREEARRGVHAG